MPIQDRLIFPCGYGSSTFSQPTKTNLSAVLKKKFRLVSGIKIKVKDLVYSEKVMLIKFDIVPDDDDP